MRTVIADKNEIELKAALHVKSVLDAKSDAVLALTAGRSTQGLYDRLSRMCAAGEISFKHARIFSVAEYVGADREHSLRAALERQLTDNIDIPASGVFSPDPGDPDAYDAMISSAGGLDLAVLGIGQNCHIGYNEPATPFDTRTHTQKLTDATRRQLIAAGVPPDRVADSAVTMGIKTLTQARDIILLAFGAEKAEPVHQMVYGKTITYIPASFLQIPLEVTVYLDDAAATKL